MYIIIICLPSLLYCSVSYVKSKLILIYVGVLVELSFEIRRCVWLFGNSFSFCFFEGMYELHLKFQPGLQLNMIEGLHLN